MRTLLLLLIGAVPAPLIGQADTTMFRGGPAHRGTYPAAGPAVAGIQWTFRTQGDVIGSAVVADRVVYVASGDGGLYALDLHTGALQWRHDLGAPSHSTPAVAGRLVYAVTRDNRIRAVNRTTGAQVWEAKTGADVPLAWGHESGDFYTSSPTVSGNAVFVGSGDGYLHALDATTGAVRWRAKTGGRVRSSPAVESGRVFVGSMDGVLYAFARADGQALWRFETMGTTLNSADWGYDRRTVQSSPAVSNGVVYVGARDGVLYAVDAATGAERWRMDHKISWVNASPGVAAGAVYAGSSDARFVQSVNAATGAEQWRTIVPSIVWSSPAVAGNLVIAGDGAGFIHALDRASGTERWRFRLGGDVFASPVVAESLVVVGAADGMIYALRTTRGPEVARAVFDDSAFAKSAWNPEHEAMARFFVNRGYERLDAAGLGAFLAARIADRQPSVVVFALDHLPPEAAGDGGAAAPLRRYLEAGGKVVWPGFPPLIWPRDSASGSPGDLKAVRWEAPGALLGVDHQRAIFQNRGARATPQGERWGLFGTARIAWGVAPGEVTEALARDEWGLAAAWVKRYGGRPGTGFLRLGTDDLQAIYRAAEYRPSAP